MEDSHVLYRGGTFLVAKKSETLVRAMQVSAALGLDLPTKQMVGWLDKQPMPEYDNTWGYWQPYALLQDGTPYLLQWARGAFGYFGAMAKMHETIPSVPAIELIDPAIWTKGVLARVMELNPDGRTQACAEIMSEQSDPEQLEDVQFLFEAVRIAQSRGTLLTDPVKIKRRLSAVR